jgi:predicted permease
MRQDLIYAIRILRKSPGFAVVAIVSLALGIGVNSVVFGVANSLLLRPLPIAAPEQVFFMEHNGSTGESYPNYKDIRDSNNVFASLAMYRIAPMSLDAGSNAQRVWGYLVTGNYFEMLGIHPAAGRFIGPVEDAEDNGSPVAVLSYDFWKHRFQGDPGIVGRTVRINTHPYTVIGVAPEGFRGLESWYRSDIWLPLSMQSQVEGYAWTKSRNNLNGLVAGWIKPGLSSAQVNENLQAIANELARQYKNNEGMRLSITRPGLAGPLRQRVAGFAAAIMLLASLVLLASCANIASMLSARLTDRKTELSIRMAIGAGRLRIARQLLTECVLISLVGGFLGVVVSTFLLDVLSQRQFHPDVPVQFAVNADARVFGFTFLLILLTAGLFGILPASRVWRSDPNQNLRGTGARTSHRRLAARDFILIAQVAMCCALVTASIVAVQRPA